MTHATGNATWQDFPSTATPVSAARLENIENSADALYASEYAAGRTKRVVARIYYNSSYVQGGTDVFGGAGWVAANDTAGGFTLGAPSYYTIPISGRLWDVQLKGNTGALPYNALFACKVSLYNPTVFQSIASDTTLGTTWNGEAELNAFTACYPLAAGDKLYWSFYCTANVTIGIYFGGIGPEFTVRDVGPA
jgi:hypothetical protein